MYTPNRIIVSKPIRSDLIFLNPHPLNCHSQSESEDIKSTQHQRYRSSVSASVLGKSVSTGSAIGGSTEQPKLFEVELIGLQQPRAMAVSLFKSPFSHLFCTRKLVPATSLPKFRATFPSAQLEGSEIAENEETKLVEKKKKVFVAGATGETGKRIVKQLLSKGFAVRAGIRDIDKAKSTLSDDQNLQFVTADVTEGSTKLAEAIGDAEAVICATGFRPSFDFLAPWKVDNFGTVNLVEACRKIGVNKFILISSILVNGAAMGQILNPAYVFLNVFGLTLIAKLQAEQYIRKSGVNFTIIRPGGLRNDPPNGNIVMKPEDTLFEGSISRDQVAEVAVEALFHPEASYKVVEIVSRVEAPKLPFNELFGAIKQG